MQEKLLPGHFRKYFSALYAAFTLLLMMTGSQRAIAQTSLYVDSAVSVSGTGTSWTTAFKTLNAALNYVHAAPATATFDIRIARGNYFPTGVQSTVTTDSFFQIKRGGIRLFGGYPTGGGTRNVAANPTVLNGNTGSLSSSADNSYHVLLIVNIPATADSIIVDGLTLTNGNASDYQFFNYYNGQPVYFLQGGAMYITHVDCPLLVHNCVFTANQSIGPGGAVYVEDDGPVFTNCTFSANTAGPYSLFSSVGGGGAMHCNGGTGTQQVTVGNCVFTGNSSQWRGGAISNGQCAPTITGCSFAGNTAAGSGGAIFSYRSNYNFSGGGDIVGCSFSGNSAPTGNGGAVLDSNSESIVNGKIRRCLFSGNSARNGGGVYSRQHAVNALSAVGVNVIDSCTFTRNTALLSGGGMYMGHYNSNLGIGSSSFDSNACGLKGGGLALIPTVLFTWTYPFKVTDCRFFSDTAAHGGGMYSEGSVQVKASRFLKNSAAYGGGLSFTSYSDCMLERNTLAGNIASVNGGGLYLRNAGSNLPFRSNLFSGNKATGKGGAMVDSFSSGLLITNCTFAGDTAASGNGLHTISANPALLNCIVREGNGTAFATTGTGAVSATYSIVQGGFAGSNNLSVDPMFISPLPPTAAPTTGGNYHVLPCSPAVNSGNNNIVYTNILDLGGNPRLLEGVVDRGAYETPAALAGIVGDTTVCLGSNVQLTNAVAGGTWVSSDPAVAAVNSSGLLTGVSVGSATITYNATVGSCAGTATRTVSVDTVNTNTVQSGAVLTADAPATSIFQWLNCNAGNSPIAGATGKSFTALSDGSYAVVVTDEYCTGTSACMTVTGLSAGRMPFAADGVTLYPVPAAAYLIVDAGKAVAQTIVLRDLLGMEMLQVVSGTAQTRIDLRAVPSGTYLVEIQRGATILRKRVQVTR